MKRILVMVVMLCSLCAVCFAKVERPTDERWVIAGGNENTNEIWIDVDSINFGYSKEIGHKQHRAAQIWFMGTNYESDMQMLVLTEFDFECRTMRRVSMSAYDGNGKFLGTFPGDVQGEPVIPGSIGEDVFSVVRDMDELRPDKEGYELYVNVLKAYTENYKNGKVV